MGEGRQADIGDERHGAVVEDVQYTLRAPEVERRSTLALERDADVFEHGQMRENGRDLKRSHQSEARHPGGRERRDVAALVDDPSPGGTHELRQQVETSRLAGAIGSDQRMNRAAANLQAHSVDRNEAGKLFGEILGEEDEIVAHDAWALLVGHSVSMSAARPAKSRSRRCDAIIFDVLSKA